LSNQKAAILHLLTTASNASPFDVNMAIDAGWDHCVPYTGVGADEVPGLTQDAIFSRGPKAVRRTGLFIGGRDIHQATEMLAAARGAMVPPFEISVLADPSGAFTTAAAMVACAERELPERPDGGLAGVRALVFGGTGPVGMTCAVLAAKAGAKVAIVSHQGEAAARQAADACAQRYGVRLGGVDGSTDAAILALMPEVELIFGAAAAGVQVLSRRHLEAATALAVACDVNAVPPQGIEGVDVMANGDPIAGTPARASGIGALAVGNVKYKTQHALLQRMIDAEGPVYLAFDEAFAEARRHA
jgi:methylene-tetrahydromethanopterin dehydrogenase